ncbi:MAG: DUF938 domain-containing protein [Herminiimonas sp.]|nr:DUF938 domain-containing protein [Herminiimonas sp.]
MSKRFSAPCERNRDPILSALRTFLTTPALVLEIGSGTGQHAAHFGANLPHLTWQTSDLPENHDSILAWIEEAKRSNVLAPVLLDMAAPRWIEQIPAPDVQVVYTANTCHIMSWELVVSMVAGVGRLLPANGLFLVYGPFNYGGLATSAGNADFDRTLRLDDPARGIRDAEAMQTLAADNGLRLRDDLPMPANNRLLIFQRHPEAG